MKTIEQYAIELVASGAESTAEDDLNEDEEVLDEDHQAACDLAIKIAQAIRANPKIVLDLVKIAADGEDRPQVVRIEGGDEDIADALAGPS